jgi:hypothetical protein
VNSSDEVAVKWDLNVELSVAGDGEMKMIATGQPGVNGEYKTAPAQGLVSFKPENDPNFNQDNNIKNDMINHVRVSLQNKLKGLGVLFKIPSSDNFEFSKPMLTNGGDFLAQTKYKG